MCAGLTTLQETHAFSWTGRDGIELYEQTRVMAQAHAVTLLSASLRDEEDDDPSAPDLPRFGRR